MRIPHTQSPSAWLRKWATVGAVVCVGSWALVGILATEASATTVTISGFATNAPNQSCVYIIDASTGVVEATTTTIGLNGDFSSSVASGNYKVQIDPSCFGSNKSETYAGAYYDSGAPNDATSVLANATVIAATTSNVDLTLTTGATFSGTVITGTGAGVANVCVYLYNATNYWAYEGQSTTGGSYAVTGIAPDASTDYEVEFDPSCGGTVSSTLAPTFWSGATIGGDDTEVAITGTDAFGPVMVPIGGTISGTVTEPNGSAAPNVCIDAFSTDDPESYLYTQKTGALGTYSFTGLAATSFLVFYDPACEDSQPTDLNPGETSGAISITPGITSTVNEALAYSGNVLSISPSTATTGTVGSSFSQGFSTSGGIAPFTWSATNLPAGLSISAASGTVSGTPTASGTTTATIVATDSSAQGVAISQSVTFNVNAAPAPTTTTTPPTTTLPYHPAAPTPRVTIGTGSIVLLKGTTAGIPVSCATATCVGTVKLIEKTTIKVAYKKKVGHRTVIAYKTKTVITVLGSVAFNLKKDKKATETLVLNAAGKALLGHATAKIAFHEFLETTVRGGSTTTKPVVVS